MADRDPKPAASFAAPAAPAAEIELAVTDVACQRKVDLRGDPGAGLTPGLPESSPLVSDR
jgi:hypothetical protein